MAAERARGQRRAVAQRAVMALESGEYGAALGRLMAMLDEE
jgi:hypothetical protein